METNAADEILHKVEYNLRSALGKIRSLQLKQHPEKINAEMYSALQDVVAEVDSATYKHLFCGETYNRVVHAMNNYKEATIGS